MGKKADPTTTESRAAREIAESRAILVAELEQKNRQLQEAGRVKSDFLANMSHELRTPLNAIMGFAELMHDGKMGPVSPEHRECLEDILTSSRHLLQLINDVVDLAKVEAGIAEFRPEPVVLERLVEELCDIVRGLSLKKRIEVGVEVASDLGTVVLDPAKLKRVLHNFLSNALRFTREGGRVTVRARAEDALHFRLEVEDTGIGICTEDLPRLFGGFPQLEAGAARSTSGSGLGLALTKRLVEAQGGHVGVTSTLAKGSLFFAVLPRDARKPEPAAPGSS